MKSGLLRVTKVLDAISEWVGVVTMWVSIPLTVFVLIEVVMRYGFNRPTGWIYDTSWMLNSILFMLGGAYTLRHQKHVQIDILYRQLPRVGALIHEVVFYVVIFLPSMLILIFRGVRYAGNAWTGNIRLSTTMWNFPAAPIRTVIPIAFGLLFLQGLSELIKCVLHFTNTQGSVKS